MSKGVPYDEALLNYKALDYRDPPREELGTKVISIRTITKAR